ncbi:hypothetical protein DN619_12260 [Klebsiella michiganensis]|uniref:Uncharacterized protein n=1 Tax=Klebsiella michiganensis TaxID=1134687 RepID=A0A2J5JFJ4_9ENTR|nr:hypothetical protein C2U44_00140 [Klebsiella oxytoca]MBX4647373.1 hypothetical protein [Klebsiella michiganensis]AUV98143.1 hypothetical protein C2U46_10910 [Klebsiella oxytoca]AUW11923.1 hypothetical protein C2U42_23090 [Klebsiella oxytoca]AVE79915.1 hypothetical protein AM355_23250 [Klebsiella oxytoca]
MPVSLRATGALAALVHPGHIAHLCSRGSTSQLPACSSNYLGYGITFARKISKLRFFLARN